MQFMIATLSSAYICNAQDPMSIYLGEKTNSFMYLIRWFNINKSQIQIVRF